MAFDAGKEDDLFACHAVRALMQFPDKVQIVSHWDGTEIPAAFARCEKIIGARFHAMVLALRMGIPFYPVIFREKMRNLILDLNYPVSGCDIRRISMADMRTFLETPSCLSHKVDFSNAFSHPRLLREKLKGR